MELQEALKWLEIEDLIGLDLVILKKKYRKLTLKYHPDKGGKTKDFVSLQAAYNFLQDCIKYPNSQKSKNQSSSDQKNYNDIDFYKNQITELQKSNSRYVNLINSQIKIIQNFYINLDQINTEYNQYNSNLSKILDTELEKLEKKYNSGWWKGAIGIKSMDKNEYIYNQNNLIQDHNTILSESQKNNLDNNYKAYQQILNQIVQGLNNSK